MSGTLYFILSAIIFGAVAVLHLLRVIRNWPMQLGTFEIPHWLSWVGAAVPGILCVWGLWLAVQ